MFFPLLEALLQKNTDLGKQHIHEFLKTGEDHSAIYKSLFTYACQQSLADHTNPNAVVFTDCLVHLLHVNRETNPADLLISHAVDFLCAIPIEPIDSTPLKPVREDAKVVSVSDLKESFDQDDVNLVIGSVRDLLSLMDNKHYFMEIIYRIALLKSPHSLILASATSRAIEIMGWQNNFTPFLIYHLIVRLFDDKTRFVLSEKTLLEDKIFEQYLRNIQSVEDLQFLAASYRTYHDCKILATQIRSMIGMRLNDYFKSKKYSEPFIEKDNRIIDRIAYQSCLEDLSLVQGIETMWLKNPFAV